MSQYWTTLNNELQEDIVPQFYTAWTHMIFIMNNRGPKRKP